MSLTIRFMQPEDRETWLILWEGYLNFYETDLPKEVSEKTFERLVDETRTNQIAMVAELNGEIIGFVHCITHATNWKIENVVYLQDLYVSPSSRGTGAGKALINAVYKWADDNETPTVYWLTQSYNQTARKLYDQVATLTPFIKYQRP